MDMIALRKFGGEIPQLPAHLLPEYAAQQSLFCDFAHGHLAPLNQGFLLATMSGTVKTIYTEDGIFFYTWPTEAWAVKSPVLEDTYNRVYYLDAGVLRVTTTAGMLTNGGPPGSSYKAGVPRPTVAPTLSIVDRNDLRDYPGATFTLKVWWESAGKRYQEASAALTQVEPLREYTFNAPARDTVNTPSDAVVRATFTATDDGYRPFMTITASAGDTDARSLALPGGVTLALTQVSGLSHRIVLTYGVLETRAYTYTCQNTWLEESPPAPPAEISVTYLQDVAVTLSAVSFSGGYRPLSVYRTYRTMGSSASYLRVREGSGLSFTDTSSKASDVLGSLDTLGYEEVPPLLDGMIRLANGCLAGFRGSTLYVSEPYRPHTWQYQLEFPKNIRGVLGAPGGLLVTTAEGGYSVVGVHPSALQPIPLPLPQAGIAQRSMVKGVNEAIFASHDGLVSVVGVQANMNQSQALFARDDWQSRYGDILLDASIRLAHHDGALVATSSTQALGFVLRTDESVAGQLTQFNVQMDSMFQLPVADTLYYSVGANVYQFRGGSPYAYTWWSRDYIWNDVRNLGAGFIRCSAPVTLSVYMDGQLWQTKTVSSGYFRLKTGRKGSRWSVKIQGTAVVEELYIARTKSELLNV